MTSTIVDSVQERHMLYIIWFVCVCMSIIYMYFISWETTSPAVINFVSHSEAPSQGVRDTSAPVVSPNDIIVMWMPPELQNWNGILTNYTVGKCGGGGGGGR